MLLSVQEQKQALREREARKAGVTSQQLRYGDQMLLRHASAGEDDWAIDVACESYGAKVDAQYSEDGSTPFIRAVLKGNLKLAEYFLKRGANINHQMINGDAALTLMAQKGAVDVVRWLLDHNAWVNLNKVDGVYSFSPFLLAAQAGQTSAVNFLISYDRQVRLNRSTLSIAKQLALKNSHKETAQCLERVEKGWEDSKKFDEKIAHLSAEAQEREIKDYLRAAMREDVALRKSLVQHTANKREEEKVEAKAIQTIVSHETKMDEANQRKLELAVSKLQKEMSQLNTDGTLQILQANSGELKQVITNQQILERQKAEVAFIQQDKILKNYYLTLIILLTDSLTACKAIHSNAGPAQTPNSEMDIDDYVVKLIKIVGSSVPGLSQLCDVKDFISTRNKLAQINQIVRFLPTMAYGEWAAEVLARKLTICQQTELKALPSQPVSLIRGVINMAKGIKCRITANDIDDDPICRLAKDHCEKILNRIVQGKFQSPCQPHDIDTLVVSTVGNKSQNLQQTNIPTIAFSCSSLVAPSSSSSYQSIGFFGGQTGTATSLVSSASTSANSVKPATVAMGDPQRVEEKMDALHKQFEAIKDQVNIARREAKEANQRVSQLTGLGGSSVQMYASSSSRPQEGIDVEDLARTLQGLSCQVKELQICVAQLQETQGNSQSASSECASHRMRS